MIFCFYQKKLEKQILGESETIIEPKKSHYNSEVFVNNCCVCDKKAEDVHHIKFQCTANSNNIIDTHIVKDVKSNLVSLCKKCHNEVHNGQLIINGYIQTSNGVKLDYKYISNDEFKEKKKNNKKYSDSDIQIITSLKTENPKMTVKQYLIYLEKNHNINISSSTFNKIIKNKY